LIIKGLEGSLAGAIRDGKNTRRDILGWFVGAVAMVIGYFLVEAYVMGFGVPASLKCPATLFTFFQEPSLLFRWLADSETGYPRY
jgi:uncharacterized membrane protein